MRDRLILVRTDNRTTADYADCGAGMSPALTRPARRLKVLLPPVRCAVAALRNRGGDNAPANVLSRPTTQMRRLGQRLGRRLGSKFRCGAKGGVVRKESVRNHASAPGSAPGEQGGAGRKEVWGERRCGAKGGVVLVRTTQMRSSGAGRKEV